MKNDQRGQLSILALDFNFGIWSKMSMPNFTFQGDFRGSVKIIYKVCIEQEKWRPENCKTLRSLELFCGLVSVCIWGQNNM